MTQDYGFDEAITSESELRGALTQLLAAAYANDVPLGKPWLCRSDDGMPDWELQIVELDSQYSD